METDSKMHKKGVTDEHRQKLLQEAVDSEMLKGNAQIIHKTDYAAVLETGKKVNHILHLLLALVTFGIWLPVWLFIAAFGNTRKKTLKVDSQGNVNTETAGSGTAKIFLVLLVALILFPLLFAYPVQVVFLLFFAGGLMSVAYFMFKQYKSQKQ